MDSAVLVDACRTPFLSFKLAGNKKVQRGEDCFLMNGLQFAMFRLLHTEGYDSISTDLELGHENVLLAEICHLRCKPGRRVVCYKVTRTICQVALWNVMFLRIPEI